MDDPEPVSQMSQIFDKMKLLLNDMENLHIQNAETDNNVDKLISRFTELYDTLFEKQDLQTVLLLKLYKHLTGEEFKYGVEEEEEESSIESKEIYT
jgi:hypothetical protein